MAALNRRKNEELQTLLEARTQELRSSESRFQTMASISPVGIFLIARGDVVYVNNAWHTISGVPRDANPNIFLDYVHPDDLEFATGIWTSLATALDGAPPVR